MNHWTLAFRGGIASSQMAAAIKFGLEALPSVRAVHFQADAVEVLVDGGSGQMQDLRQALASAGIDPEIAEVRNDPADHQPAPS